MFVCNITERTAGVQLFLSLLLDIKFIVKIYNEAPDKYIIGRKYHVINIDNWSFIERKWDSLCVEFSLKTSIFDVWMAIDYCSQKINK